MKKSIVDDAMQLCSSILSKRGKYAGYHAYGFDYLPISQVKTKNGFIYKYPETLITLEELSIIVPSNQTIQLPDEEDIDIKSDGYRLIEFNFVKAKKWIGKQLQKEDPDISKQKLVFYTAGKVIYFTKMGSKHEYSFNINDNPYKLLRCLAQSAKNIISYESLEKVLKEPRRGAEGTPERRISQSVGDIIKKLGLKHTTDLFMTNKGYGIDCIVEFR